MKNDRDLDKAIDITLKSPQLKPSDVLCRPFTTMVFLLTFLRFLLLFEDALDSLSTIFSIFWFSWRKMRGRVVGLMHPGHALP